MNRHNSGGTRYLCVVGAGQWGKNHIKTLNEMGNLGGIVEKDPVRLAELSDKYPLAKKYACIENALKDGYDGYIVATPAESHFEIGSLLLQLKQNVMLEKPMTLCSTDSMKLIEIAKETGGKLMVGHILLFHPAIKKIKELINEGKIGELWHIYSNRLNLGRVRSKENVLWSFAPHDISVCNYLAEGQPVSVGASGGCFLQDGNEDTVIANFTYPNKVKAHIFVSWLHPFKEQRLVITGSKGMLVFDDSSPDKQIVFYNEGIDWIGGNPIVRKGSTEIIEYEKASPLEKELEYFINHLDSKIAISDGKCGYEVVETLEKITALLVESGKRTVESEQPDFFVHESSYIDDGVCIGKGTKVWHFCHIQKGARIGENCSIGQNVNIAGNVYIGNSVKIQNNVSVYEGVELEDYVFCGPSMVFTNIIDPRCKYPQRGSDYYLKTLVREGASIGANATIVCGHTIGRHAFIAAGAVVASNVQDYALMAGVPARRIGWICECGERLKDELICKRCGRVYKENDGILSEAN